MTRIVITKPSDPFSPVIEAKRKAFMRKWGIELVGSDDPRLSQPVQPPANGSAKMSLREITNQLMALARSAGYRG